MNNVFISFENLQYFKSKLDPVINKKTDRVYVDNIITNILNIVDENKVENDNIIEQILQIKADKEYVDNNILSLSNNVYTKSEVNKLIEDININIGDIEISIASPDKIDDIFRRIVKFDKTNSSLAK